MLQIFKMGLIVLGVILVGAINSAHATPIQFSTNGNWYELIDDPYSTWTEANSAANLKTYNGLTGHLATITSAEEDSFIFTTLGIANQPIWLGGFQESTAEEPLADWKWVTGEKWSYTNWAIGEPNNSTWADEDALAFAFFEGTGTWNDAPKEWPHYTNGGYVVEYESAPVPEPTTMLLFGTGLIGLAVAARRKVKK